MTSIVKKKFNNLSLSGYTLTVIKNCEDANKIISQILEKKKKII
jgi:hypothetical protein